MKNNLTPEQLACIKQATDALERLRELITTGDPPHNTRNDMTPEEVYEIVTCKEQRPMTLQLFKNALNHLSAHNDQLEYLRLKKMFEGDEQSH